MFRVAAYGYMDHAFVLFVPCRHHPGLYNLFELRTKPAGSGSRLVAEQQGQIAHVFASPRVASVQCLNGRHRHLPSAVVSAALLEYDAPDLFIPHPILELKLKNGQLLHLSAVSCRDVPEQVAESSKRMFSLLRWQLIGWEFRIGGAYTVDGEKRRYVFSHLIVVDDKKESYRGVLFELQPVISQCRQ